jgi:CubicO group peptidase (beta-lactamase class C family)
MNRSRMLLATGFLLFCALSCVAQSLPKADLPKADLPKADLPEDAGFSPERMSRITAFFQNEVDKGNIPGAVLIVGREGLVVYQKAIGYQDHEKKIAMKSDAIFRIYSMTKPITTVAVMMLAEEGKIDLLAPVSQYLPEFKNLKVGVEKPDSAGKPVLTLEDQKTPMTVHDLLRHTSGIVYGPLGEGLVHEEYKKANLLDNGQTLAEMVTQLSKLPLAHQPGTVFEYGLSTDVLARIVEVVSGAPFDRFIAERITKPLQMNDTGFYLSAAQAPRVAEAQVNPVTNARPDFEKVENLTKEKVKWFSGGSGLLSTANDYARFCQMLINGGELDGVRLLSPKTVAIMTSDQLGSSIAHTAFLEGFSFGLGFAVRTAEGRTPLPGSVGWSFWDGAAGTFFWIDPQEKLFAVMMVQLPSLSRPYERALDELVYGALVE